MTKAKTVAKKKKTDSKRMARDGKCMCGHPKHDGNAFTAEYIGSHNCRLCGRATTIDTYV